MRSVRNRLLLLLVILPVAASVVWTTAQAGLTPRRTEANAVVRTERPTVGPTSGEPDVPQGSRVIPPTFHSWKGAGLPARSLTGWIGWTGRIWMVRYLGVK
jgi:hypothetical protein